MRTRLEILQPHKPAVSAALAFMALPPRNLHLPKMVWTTADRLWQAAAGDTATDFNHYTKRLLLAGVLTSTTLYWLNDKSHGQENTWAFLDRRIANVLKVGQKNFVLQKEAAGAGLKEMFGLHPMTLPAAYILAASGMCPACAAAGRAHRPDRNARHPAQ